MAATVVDNVKIKVLSTGTGALQLGSAVDGYRGLEALTNGQIYNYAIRTNGIYEIGQGTYLSASSTLSRSVQYSSNGNDLVTLPPNCEASFVALAADLNGTSLSAEAIAAANTATEASAQAQDVLADISAIAAPLAALPTASGAAIVGTASGLSVEDELGDRVKGDDLASTAAGKGVDLVGGAVAGIKGVTGKFITNLDGAVVNRVGDRLFVGGANSNDGNFPNNIKDWYTTYEVAQGRPNGIIVSSQAAILTNEYFGAAVGLTVAAQTKHFVSGVGGAVALEAHVVNNNIVTNHDAWAFYCEATRDAEGVGAIITAELDSRNKGNFHAIGPNNQHPKQSVVLQIASGAALSATGVTDISAGINFRDNPTKMGAGIVFGVNAIRGTNGSTGYGNAILIGPRQRISWTDLSDNETGSIQSTITNVANNTRMAFSDLGTIFLGPSDTTNLIIRPVASAANYWDMAANTAGNAPVLKASGSDANIDLQIEPKGTGLLRFGNATSMVANGSVATNLGSVGPTGARTTVQKWLSVKDSSGTQLYIPCF